MITWSKSPANWRLAAALLVAMGACTEKDAVRELPEDLREPAETPDPYERSPSRFGIVPLHAGFTPDPRVVGGTALGEGPAKSIHRKCKGWISESSICEWW